ncbi:MAG: DUF2089 family protein [candidate division Zixibacteria bacterium]|nr:DUF2089 family protein [candidate division Zixibacteria bacterium]
MIKEWQELTKFIENHKLVVERIRLLDKDIAIEGEFELPPLAKLSYEDQVFIAAFIKSHGSIKQMESIFGVSYPTIKNRLNRLGEQFDFVNIESAPSRRDTLEELERGEISIDEAIKRLKS